MVLGKDPIEYRKLHVCVSGGYPLGEYPLGEYPLGEYPLLAVTFGPPGASRPHLVNICRWQLPQGVD